MHAVLRHNKQLRIYNKGYITDRLMAMSGGNMILCYNGYNELLELHDARSIKHDRNSLQASFRDTQQINGYLLREIKANDYRRFMNDIQEEKGQLQRMHDSDDEYRMQTLEEKSMRTVEHYLGRKF